ncbi:MAG: hypothetical protein MK101_10010 [Phycisphaerales bacterium]|nr:hypothetical protein [Phycisphaerales bacterium]
MLAMSLLALLAATTPAPSPGAASQDEPAGSTTAGFTTAGLRSGPTHRVAGTVEQIEPLPAPQDGMLEVFVRKADGALVQAIVPETWATQVQVGASIDFASRPDGTYSYRDQNGQRRTVERVKAIEAPAATSSGVDDLTLMLGLLVLLMAGFGILALLVARSRSSRRSVGELIEEGDETVPCDDDEPPLPGDPADAMAELMRRAQNAEQ